MSKTLRISSRKDTAFTVVMGGTVLFCFALAIPLLYQPLNRETMLGGVVILVSNALLLWLWLGTSYSLSDTHLGWKSGPLRGCIPLKDIKKITVGKTLWVGMRPATALGGLIIHYQAYEEIYISPKDQEAFVALLESRVPDLKVIRP
ncbi:MAG: PH domain-containing protein [Flavobacteriaceae bacterium]